MKTWYQIGVFISILIEAMGVFCMMAMAAGMAGMMLLFTQALPAIES